MTPRPLTAEEEAIVRREAERGGLSAAMALRVFATLDAERARAAKLIAAWHDKLLNSPATCGIHKHALGTAKNYPGFGCEGCDLHAALSRACGATCPS